MNKEQLKPVTLPPGTPLLMQGQTFPFNGDGYAAAEVLRLKAKHGIVNVFETGTCLGVTTTWFAANFGSVITCELSQRFAGYASHILRECPNVLLCVGDSPEWVKNEVPTGPTLYFLDAHGISGKGEAVCPLLAELDAIAQAGIRPVLMIHDWQVPDRPDLGHDYFPDGRPFSLENITAALDLIYGRDGWEHHYNDEAEGARRGILYVEPKASTPA
jgi:hypothetical protein